MKTRKIILWLLAGLLAAVLIVAATLYLLCSIRPGQYAPAVLNPQQRTVAAKQFYRKVMDFDDGAQSNATFSWSLTAEQINQYLASLDEIAALLPDGKAGEVQKLMADTGLSDPAVVLGNGCVTLMVDSSRYDKVVSVELQFAMDERKNLQIRLSGVRIGLLSMPEDFVTDNLLKLRQKLLQRRSEQDKDNPGAGGSTGSPPRAESRGSSTVARIAERGANLFDVMLATIEGKPFVPAGKWKGRLIRLEGLEITPQRLTLQILPTPRPKSKSSQRSDRLAAPSDVEGPRSTQSSSQSFTPASTPAGEGPTTRVSS